MILYKVLVVSLPDFPQMKMMAKCLGTQGLSWEWMDGVRIERVEGMEPEEYRGLETCCVLPSEGGSGVRLPSGVMQTGHAERPGSGEDGGGGLGDYFSG